jgi:hypothetical protein
LRQAIQQELVVVGRRSPVSPVRGAWIHEDLPGVAVQEVPLVGVAGDRIDAALNLLHLGGDKPFVRAGAKVLKHFAEVSQLRFITGVTGWKRFLSCLDSHCHPVQVHRNQSSRPVGPDRDILVAGTDVPASISRLPAIRARVNI